MVGRNAVIFIYRLRPGVIGGQGQGQVLVIVDQQRVKIG